MTNRNEIGDDGAFERELLRHARGLRLVARDLVGDSHAAEDIVQNTMRQAVASRDLAPGPLGGWLRRTAINFARQWRRTERRRERRERERTGPGDERDDRPTAAEAASRREVLRTVTEAVLALEEPYQTTVFLRYFEDLPPRVIARRTGANLATVKSRLQRGLALLRARLDRMAGGDRDRWRLALAGTLALPFGSAAGIAWTTGALLMGTTTKALLAAGVLGALGICLFGFGEEPVPQAVAGTNVGQRATATTAAVANETDRERTAVTAVDGTSTAASPTWLAHPYTFALKVRFVDELGLAVAGQTLRLAPDGCPFNSAPDASDADGIVRVNWPSRTPSGEVLVQEPDGVLRRIELRDGAETTVTLLAESPSPAMRLPKRAAGQPAVLYEIAITNYFSNGVTTTSAPRFGPGMHPFARFGIGPAPQSSAVVRADNTVLRYIESRTQSAAVQLMLSTSATEAAPDATERTTSVAGTVYGEDGEPARELPVQLLDAGGKPFLRWRTDEQGHFEFDQLQRGEFTVRAGGDARGLATARAITTTGTTPVTLNLHRGSTVRGRVAAANGAAVAKLRVTWHAADGSWCDRTETADDGTFAFANLPGTVGTVRVWCGSLRFPVAVAADVLCDVGPLLLHAEGGASELRVTPSLPPGLDDDVGRTIVQVWNLDHAVGTALPAAASGSAWVVDHVPAGWYRVIVHHPATGTVDAGRHWVDGATPCDLGQVLLPEPATLVRADEPQSDRELYAIRTDLDVRIDGEPERLAAGEYALFWSDAGGAPHVERFAARPGHEVRLPATR